MEQRFYTYGNQIIDTIEGGYYHPNMKIANPTKFEIMGNSGETMFGIDRKAGGSDVTTDIGAKFWELIDAQNAAKNWSYNYKATGTELGNTLRKYASEMMYNRYQRYSDLYLKDYKDIIKKSPKLEVHFFYACWNGAKWFEQFAKEIKNAGTKNIANLEEVALNSRINNKGFDGNRGKNSLIATGGEKIKKIWNKYSTVRNTAKIIFIFLAVSGVVSLGIAGYYKLKGK